MKIFLVKTMISLRLFKRLKSLQHKVSKIWEAFCFKILQINKLINQKSIKASNNRLWILE